MQNKTVYQYYFNTNVLLDTIMFLLSIVFLGIMANISVPLWPVPITMQTFGVFVIAFFFGSKKGVISILAYLLAGIAGFAVFAGYKSGFQTLIGPTSGYLIGFIFMVFFIGKLIENGHGRTRLSVLKIMFLGEAILYLFGLSGLWVFLGMPGIIKVLTLGFFPFIVGDILKIIAGVSLFPLLWKGHTKI